MVHFIEGGNRAYHHAVRDNSTNEVFAIFDSHDEITPRRWRNALEKGAPGKYSIGFFGERTAI